MVQTPLYRIEYRAPDALPDDTEESVVGTQWHQEAISALTGMLQEVAARRGATWGVCDQIALTGLRHADGHPYDPRPDVMVLPLPLPSGNVSSIALADVATPLFIAEVASTSTFGNDVGDKRAAYAAIGVPEYIVFDPDGALLSTPLLAWRLEGGAYVPWKPDGDGWWQSAALDVSFRATQPLLTIRDRDRQLIAPPRIAWEQARRVEQIEQRLRDIEAELRRWREDHGA